MNPFPVRYTQARSILTKTSGFLAEAGFTHSLSPARNCTFGCTYCYVPTMGPYGGTRAEDRERWGQFSTFKTNANELLLKHLRPNQVIYCSPLVDPYQPAEADAMSMPPILEALPDNPPRVFVLQTRGSLVLRDLELLKYAGRFTKVRVSFSITTDRDDIRKLYEPHCSPIPERLEVIRKLRDAGLEVYATLAPLLPCDPEALCRAAIEASGRDLIGDPLHLRSTKPAGSTTREAAFKIAQVQAHREWLEAGFQAAVVKRIERCAHDLGHSFGIGPRGFAKLAV